MVPNAQPAAIQVTNQGVGLPSVVGPSRVDTSSRGIFLWLNEHTRGQWIRGSQEQNQRGKLHVICSDNILKLYLGICANFVAQLVCSTLTWRNADCNFL